MTVEELLKHFRFYFDKIVFFNKTHNIQDTAHLYEIDSLEQTVNNETEFLNEYGDYKVTDWKVKYDDSLITDIYIWIEIEKE